MCIVRLTDKKECDKIGHMISYEAFTKAFTSGEIQKLHFYYDSKEYLIAREAGEEAPVFSFTSGGHKPVIYPSLKALLNYAIIGGKSLREVWYHITPVCNDTLLDDDYILTLYSDSFGKVLCSGEGTASSYGRYLTKRFFPTLAMGAILILVTLACTLLINILTWTFFAVACAIVVGAILIALLIFFTNTKRFRRGNPQAHFYLLNHGAVILTSRSEYAIPYAKIIRLGTEAGITIVTWDTVFTFVADDGKEISETLSSIVEELKSIKRRRKKHS